MKKQRRQPAYYASKTKQSLLGRIHILMSAPLGDEVIAKHAVFVLRNAEKFGFKFVNLAQDDFGCALCLYLSLANASREITKALEKEKLGQMESQNTTMGVKFGLILA